MIASRLTLLLLALLGALACGPADGSRALSPSEQLAFDEARRKAATLDRADAPPAQRVKAWSAVAELRPDGVMVLQLLGQAQLDARLLGEAASSFERALELLPTTAQQAPARAELMLALARVLSDLGEDTELLALSTGFEPPVERDAELSALLALAEDRLGQRELASARLDAALARELPDSWRLLALRGRFDFETGAFEDARRAFQSAISQRPDCKPALKGLADVERRSGNDELADRWDEILQLIVDLTNDVILGREPSFRRPRLERLAELHPRWNAGWIELLDMLRAEQGEPAACERLHEILAKRPPGLSTAQRVPLLQRYCGDDR